MLLGKKKMNSKGFTMVELLAAVTILAVVSLIAIKGVSGLIDRAKEERVIQQQKTLTIAAESYLQANSQFKPKTIGESRLIEVSTLKKANYLKDDITNAAGESCMKNSVVRVYKLSKMEYSYYPYIYCGDERAPETITPPRPSASMYFTDASGKPLPIRQTYTDVSKAKLAIKFYGYDYTISNPDKNIAIDSYNYVIYQEDKTGKRTVYDSGSLSANRKNEVTVSFDLKDYIDLTGSNMFYITVFVRNVHGGEITIDRPVNGGAGAYDDTKSPSCVAYENEAVENEWINKYSSVSERTITATCDDGDGSGCVRDTFSRTWPNKYQKSAEFAYIRVSDNAGNTFPGKGVDYLRESCTSGTWCCVRVNVDTVAPTINLKAYKYNGSTTTGQNILSNKYTTADDSSENQTVTINTKNFSGNIDGWLNAKNFTNGIAFKVNISDDIGLYSWKWETNVPGIKDASDDRLEVVSAGNDDGKEETYWNGRKKSQNGINIKLEKDGRRKGVLTVRDIAGNETKYVIYVNIGVNGPTECNPDAIDECIDDKFPKTGLKLYKFRDKDNANKGDPYTPGEWTNLSVIAAPSDEVADYVISHPGSYFEYLVYTESSGNNNTVTVGPFTGRNNTYVFDNSKDPISNGKNKISLNLCTQSKNCVSTDTYDVYIDTVAPDCNLTAKRSDNNKAYDGKSWLGIGVNAIVTATCSDTNNKWTTSGCENTTQWPKSFSYTYNFDVNANNAGAKGLDNDGNTHGAVKDIAGNITECPADKTVKVDHVAPTCTVSAKLNKNSDYDGTWKKKGNTITVSGVCSDTGGDGSGSGCMIYSGSLPTFDSTKTTKSFDYTTNINTTKATPSGNDVKTTVIDGAGNTTVCSSKTVKLDVTAPECGTATNSASSGVWRRNSSITITQNCLSDNLSGCDNSRNYSKTYTTDTASDTITIYDNAGNDRACTVYVNRDTVPPTCGSKDADPTSYATERTRTVNCNKGSGTAVSDCTKAKFSRSWSYAVDGKVDDSYITISDKAGNTRDCPVKVMVDQDLPEPDPGTSTNICDLGTDENALFGNAISSSSFSLSGTKTFTYKHYDKGNSGGGTNFIEFTVTDNKIYNYFPSTGSSSFANHAYGFLATWRNSGKWCHANGTSCGNDGKDRWCYARVCKNESLCGSYLGWTAEAISYEWTRQGCPSHTFARCWCSCSSGNVGRDWFN